MSQFNRRDHDEDEEYFELDDCTIVHFTGSAVLIRHEGDEFWVPLSLVNDPSQFHQGQRGATVEVKEWFARKEGMI